MRARPHALVSAALLLSAAAPLYASVFGSMTGIVHDPDHRPIAGATITLVPLNHAHPISAITAADGSFNIPGIPVGEYSLTVCAPGFAQAERTIAILSDRTFDLHQALNVESVKESVSVNAASEDVSTTSAAATQLISAQQIARTPDADSANSMSIITDYVPSAVMTHDQLHVRGGHQITWLIDGVPVPNTNIASNVGPQFDPKDIDYLETETGGYSAEKGDRTYGVFNVVPRSGFERNGEAEIISSFGSQNTTDNQVNFGNHSQRFAYYGSVSANRTDVGLETPTAVPLHDEASGQSVFTSVMFNRTPSDQLRFIGSARNDYFQVPNDFDLQASGVRDSERERDVFTNFTWLHTRGQKFSFALSPFLHFNEAHYTPGQMDAFATNSDRGSNYFGGNATATAMLSKNTLRAGYEAFGQRENDLFDNFGTDATVTPFRSRTIQWGSNQSVYAEDQFRPWSWLNLNAGLRTTHFSGGVSETSTDPRIGGGITIPKLGWMLHAFYGHYYQAPPLFTVADALSSAADLNGLGFLPLHGEHDVQREFGITIPVRQWSVEVTHFQTSARNYFDHDALGSSNVFLPLTIANARIRGWETSLRSPQIAHHGRVHLAYSHQFAQARGAVSGGLTDFQPADSSDFFFLDHDQRDTLSVGGEVTMRGTWFSTNVNYGSGFVDGEGPEHLPSHTTADVALGHDFGERWTAKLTATNLMDNRYLIDNSNSFGGTHVVQPRRVMLQVRYRFHAAGRR